LSDIINDKDFSQFNVYQSSVLCLVYKCAIGTRYSVVGSAF